MSIERIPYPNSLPTEQNDYVKQNNLIETAFLNINKPRWEDSSNNIVKGAVFQIGGTVYLATSATAITGTPSDYIKLTPSGDGSTCSPSYVANLTGVSWNTAYNGYYDVSGNLYIFDEMKAYNDGEITIYNNKIWKAISEMLDRRKGAIEIQLSNYTGTSAPQIVAGSGIEINGKWYYTDSNVTITGSTANDTWYDILFTPSGSSFTCSYVARSTGTWSDSKQGLYSGNNRVGACVYRDSSGNFRNKNVIIVNNRTVEIKLRIGTWNMVANNAVNINFGLTLGKLRDIGTPLIIDDLGLFRYPLTYDSAMTNIGGTWRAQSGSITLLRRSGGQFDSTNFDSTSINRGYFTLTYEV